MKLKVLLLFILLPFILDAQSKPNQQWLDNKFFMFIHFGLYSNLGGVWQGDTIRQGYSEQIQSFAGIFSDWYADTGKSFQPNKWNADSIVALAKDAGMRSIVLTAKHHDGFCMYDSDYTNFNIVDATPYEKDILKSLADACHKANVGFGIYFSLIDWHYPHAYPISSHNADPITPKHHQYNILQVTELMTRYGDVSEIWFDMGSLQPEQSKELYNLVDSLQPNCMISGRLGNNYSDFVVMPDNDYPDYQIGTPWQTAASMFDETWGYRSWQERGEIDEKVNEKLWSLINVISKGGNYLLNIGPKPNGAVVFFEKEVLKKMGEWLQTNGEAIYGSSANPYHQTFEWGEITTKDNSLYLFLRDNSAQEIVLPNIKGDIDYIEELTSNKKLGFKKLENTLKIKVDRYQKVEIPVIKIKFTTNFEIQSSNKVNNNILTANNATPIYGFSNPDYYSGYKTIIRYDWTINNRKNSDRLDLFYTDDLIGKKILLNIDNNPMIKRVLFPEDSIAVTTNQDKVTFKELYYKKGSGIFGHVKEENHQKIVIDDRWQLQGNFNYDSLYTQKIDDRESIILLQEIEAQEDVNLLLTINYGNGFYLLLNGQYITANFDLERKENNQAKVLLPLKKGNNQIVIKLYNRDAKYLNFGIKPEWRYKLLHQRVNHIHLKPYKDHFISLQLANPTSAVAPIELNNLSIEFK